MINKKKKYKKRLRHTHTHKQNKISNGSKRALRASHLDSFIVVAAIKTKTTNFKEETQAQTIHTQTHTHKQTLSFRKLYIIAT